MKRQVWIILLLMLPIVTFGQTKHKTAGKGKVKPASHIVKQPVPPVTTVSYSYYDDNRGGYIFMDNGRQSFLPALPVLPENAVPATSIPLSKKLSLDLYPQLHYPNTRSVHPDRNNN